MVERKLQRLKPPLEVTHPSDRKPVVIQGRAVGPDRQHKVGTAERRGKKHSETQPRRSDVLFSLDEQTGEPRAEAFQPGLLVEDDIFVYSRDRVAAEDPNVGEKVKKARKKKTTREYWKIPLGLGAEPGFKIKKHISKGPNPKARYPKQIGELDARPDYN